MLSSRFPSAVEFALLLVVVLHTHGEELLDDQRSCAGGCWVVTGLSRWGVLRSARTWVVAKKLIASTVTGNKSNLLHAGRNILTKPEKTDRLGIRAGTPGG